MGTETGTRWGYESTAVEEGTNRVVAHSRGRRGGMGRTAGADAESQIRDRVEQSRVELAATLAAIKQAVASG